MEISSPRLHHGRAASYGSIIVPVQVHRFAGCNPAFQSSIYRYSRKEVSACFPDSSLHGNVSGEWYSIVKLRTQNIRSVCNYFIGKQGSFLGTTLSQSGKPLVTIRAC